MNKPAIEVITSVQRRRRWSAVEKERLVAASLEPCAGVSAVAREAGILVLDRVPDLRRMHAENAKLGVKRSREIRTAARKRSALRP